MSIQSTTKVLVEQISAARLGRIQYNIHCNQNKYPVTFSVGPSPLHFFLAPVWDCENNNENNSRPTLVPFQQLNSVTTRTADQQSSSGGAKFWTVTLDAPPGSHRYKIYAGDAQHDILVESKPDFEGSFQVHPGQVDPTSPHTEGVQQLVEADLSVQECKHIFVSNLWPLRFRFPHHTSILHVSIAIQRQSNPSKHALSTDEDHFVLLKLEKAFVQGKSVWEKAHELQKGNYTARFVIACKPHLVTVIHQAPLNNHGWEAMEPDQILDKENPQTDQVQLTGKPWTFQVVDFRETAPTYLGSSSQPQQEQAASSSSSAAVAATVFYGGITDKPVEKTMQHLIQESITEKGNVSKLLNQIKDQQATEKPVEKTMDHLIKESIQTQGTVSKIANQIKEQQAMEKPVEKTMEHLIKESIQTQGSVSEIANQIATNEDQIDHSRGQEQQQQLDHVPLVSKLVSGFEKEKQQTYEKTMQHLVKESIQGENIVSKLASDFCHPKHEQSDNAVAKLARGFSSKDKEKSSTQQSVVSKLASDFNLQEEKANQTGENTVSKIAREFHSGKEQKVEKTMEHLIKESIQTDGNVSNLTKGFAQKKQQTYEKTMEHLIKESIQGGNNVSSLKSGFDHEKELHYEKTMEHLIKESIQGDHVVSSLKSDFDHEREQTYEKTMEHLIKESIQGDHVVSKLATDFSREHKDGSGSGNTHETVSDPQTTEPERGSDAGMIATVDDMGTVAGISTYVEGGSMVAASSEVDPADENTLHVENDPDVNGVVVDVVDSTAEISNDTKEIEPDVDAVVDDIVDSASEILNSDITKGVSTQDYNSDIPHVEKELDLGVVEDVAQSTTTVLMMNGIASDNIFSHSVTEADMDQASLVANHPSTIGSDDDSLLESHASKTEPESERHFDVVVQGRDMCEDEKDKKCIMETPIVASVVTDCTVQAHQVEVSSNTNPMESVSETTEAVTLFSESLIAKSGEKFEDSVEDSIIFRKDCSQSTEVEEILTLESAEETVLQLHQNAIDNEVAEPLASAVEAETLVDLVSENSSFDKSCIGQDRKENKENVCQWGKEDGDAVELKKEIEISQISGDSRKNQLEEQEEAINTIQQPVANQEPEKSSETDSASVNEDANRLRIQEKNFSSSGDKTDIGSLGRKIGNVEKDIINEDDDEEPLLGKALVSGPSGSSQVVIDRDFPDRNYLVYFLVVGLLLGSLGYYFLRKR